MKQKLKKYWKNLVTVLTKKELSILPGQLAFFFVLSIIPILSLIFIMANWLNLSYDVIVNFVQESFSKDLANIITPIITGKTFDYKFIVFLLIAFLIATNAANSVIITSNTVFNIPSSDFLTRRIKSVILTIIMILLMIFILMVPVFGQYLLHLADFLGIENEVLQIFQSISPMLKWPISIFIIFFFIKIIYTIAPDAQIPSSYVNKGALFTTFLWLIASFLYSYYIGHIARYDLFYGGLSNIIILMLWFYLMAYIFVVGLAINCRNVEEYIEKTNSLNLKEIQKAKEK